MTTQSDNINRIDSQVRVDSFRLGSFRHKTLLLLPTLALFIIFFIIPLGLMLPIAFNPAGQGLIRLEPIFTLDNFIHFFRGALYHTALWNTMEYGFITAVLSLLMGYPLAYVMARTHSLRRLTFYMIMILIPFQIDVIVRIFGLIVLLGDNGLINDTLIKLGLIQHPLPLMYNQVGVIIGTTQFALPFVVLTLVGVIKGVNPELIDAARSLGASYWQAFFRIILPLSLPGILAASLIAFAMTISNYAIPVMMSAWRTPVLSSLIFQQVVELANFRFASTIAIILLGISLAAVYLYYRLIQRFVEAGT